MLGTLVTLVHIPSKKTGSHTAPPYQECPCLRQGITEMTEVIESLNH